MIYLQITPFFPTPERYNGAFIFDQVRAIERQGGFERVVVMRPTSWHTLRLEYVYQGITVHLFRALQLPSMILPGLFDGLNKWLFLRRLRQVGIDPKKIAVAHAHVSGLGIYALAVKKVAPGALTVLQYHDLDPVTLMLGRLARWSWHKRRTARRGVAICSHMDLHVAVSQRVLENIQAFPFPSSHDHYEPYVRMLDGLPNIPRIAIRKSTVLYNGVDGAKFAPCPGGDRRKSSLFTIGCVGEFLHLKGQMTLIQAVEMLVKQKGMRDISVHLIGSGPLLAGCREYVRLHGLTDQVVFLRELPHEQLRMFFGELDLFVLPSTFEGFGCVYVEAHACGVPFICVRDQGISEYIDANEADKWMIDPGNAEQLAERIARFRKEQNSQVLKHTININALTAPFLARCLRLQSEKAARLEGPQSTAEGQSRA